MTSIELLLQIGKKFSNLQFPKLIRCADADSGYHDHRFQENRQHIIINYLQTNKNQKLNIFIILTHFPKRSHLTGWRTNDVEVGVYGNVVKSNKKLI